MSAPTTTPQPQLNDGVSGMSQIQLALQINSCRVIAVAEQLAMCAQTPDQIERFHGLCLSLARGIDYGLAQNEVPSHTSKLPPVLKMVCNRKNEFYLQPAIMVLMISVKNACKLNWFPAQDTEELLALADEVASNFVTRKDFGSEVCNLLPTVSTVISRYYPHFKLGNVLASLEVKPGYGTHLVDFHITKDIIMSKEEKIYLLVAMKDNIDTSACIITPQEVNVLLNGNAVERRNRASMDSGPQLPTAVNRYLKYGINLLQIVGQFNGNYILIIALMTYDPSSSHLPTPQDYEQPVSSAISSDCELIEGPSRVSLNCPISKTRIRTPVKGHLCKHYQCFDFTTFVEMNFKRPSWRCPNCNKYVSFTDLRIDQKMVKALQEVGEKDTEVVFSIDGSFKPSSSNKQKDDSHDKSSSNQLGNHEIESHTILDTSSNMLDLTAEDEEMETTDRSEPLDIKPVIHPNVQSQSLPSPVTTTALAQFSLPQVPNNQSPRQVINSSFLNPISSTFSSNSTAMNLVQDALYTQGISMMNNNNPMQFTRNVTRVSSAIQALPVQPPNTSQHLTNTSQHLTNISRQQHSRPINLLPGSGQQHSRPNTVSGQQHSRANTTSGPFSFPLPVGINAQQHSSPYGSNVERQHHLSQSNSNTQLPNTALVSLQSRSLSQGVGQSTPTHNAYLSQTLSQPPHMRSQLPRNHNPHGVGSTPRPGLNNSTPSNFQRVQLMTSQASPTPMRPPHTTIPLQTQPNVRNQSSSLPLTSSGNVTPQAVSRTENLIDLQSEQSWRPRARMRGALLGPEYDALRSQLESGGPPAQTPSPRPAVPLSRPSIDILLANRRLASELDKSGNGTQEDGSQGVK